jgi:ketosteroid isomerase-like protein
MSVQDPITIVEELWRRYGEGGLPAAVKCMREDARWTPHDSLGQPLVGREAILARGREMAAAGVRVESFGHRFEDLGDGCVVVTGRVRVLGPDGHYDVPMHWQVDVVDGLVAEVRAERRLEDARADCAA